MKVNGFHRKRKFDMNLVLLAPCNIKKTMYCKVQEDKVYLALIVKARAYLEQHCVNNR